MICDRQTLLDAALQLSVTDRAHLVRALTETLSDDDLFILDEEWREELDRRHQQLINDPCSGTPAKDVLKTLRAGGSSTNAH